MNSSLTHPNMKGRVLIRPEKEAPTSQATFTQMTSFITGVPSPHPKCFSKHMVSGAC